MTFKNSEASKRFSSAPSEYPRGFVYQLLPIDFWVGFTPAHRVAKRPTGTYNPENYVTQDEVFGVVHHATCEILRRTHWQGDLREEPWIGALPPPGGDCRTMLLVGLKQDHSGGTYIWSPVELPWLRAEEGARDV